MGWGTRLLVGFVLILAGAAAAVWGLSRYQPAARVLGVVPAAQPVPLTSRPLVTSAQPRAPQPALAEQDDQTARIKSLELRLAQVENATQRAEGSAGRADALVVAFAARRAIDRGVALGYLEKLLAERFGSRHQQAVATIITASRQPIRLDDLRAQFEALGPQLRRGGPQDNWWSDFKRELGSLVEIHRAERPAVNADARFRRAQQRLESGDVDRALAEAMRLPGAGYASDWVAKARRYIAAHRALDELESAALLDGGNSTG